MRLVFPSQQVILIVIAFGFPFAPGYSAAAVGVFSAMPWALLAKGVQDLADASQGERLHCQSFAALCNGKVGWVGVMTCRASV